MGPGHGSTQGAPPGHFRITDYKSHTQKTSLLLKEQVFQEIGGPEAEGQEVKVPPPMSWYSKEHARHTNLGGKI